MTPIKVLQQYGHKLSSVSASHFYFASCGRNLRPWAIFLRPCFEKHSWALQFSLCCKLSKLTIKRKKKIMQSAWVGKLYQHMTQTLSFYFLLLVLKASKNMLMKDITHSRLSGVGIYSLHTTFYAKIINIQLNQAAFIL